MRKSVPPLALAASLALAAAGCKKGVPPPPPRPETVAAEAAWVPGGTGGVWILCKAHPDRDDCTVWGLSGRVWASGAYLLTREQRPAPQSDLKYLAFDEDRIFLENGFTLSKR